MLVIDKSMYAALKNWRDKNKHANRFMMYVNSCDRSLTDATVRKLMFDIQEQDLPGEQHVSYYSARAFRVHMRQYYSHIAKLYGKDPKGAASVTEIAKRIPAACGWITLIIGDAEALAGDEETTEELFRSLYAFACKRANVILIGNRGCKEAFSGCAFALRKMTEGIMEKQEAKQLTINCYDQEQTPEKERIVYDSEEKQRDALCFFWDTVYNQLEKGYFDYKNFTFLIRETLAYLVPRVTQEQVYRKDLELIGKTGAMLSAKSRIADGCKPWEYDAAKEIAAGLHSAITNANAANDCFPSGKIWIDVFMEDPDVACGAVHTGGYTALRIPVRVDTVCKKTDALATAIRDHTYKKRTVPERICAFLEDDDAARSAEQPK